MRYAERLRPRVTDTSKLLHDALRERQGRAARGRAGHDARPRPGDLSVRHVVEPRHRVRARVRRHRPARGGAGDRHHEGVRDPGRRAARSRPRITVPRATAWASAGRSSAPSTGRKRRCGWFDAVILRYAAPRERARPSCSSPSSTSCPGSRPSGSAPAYRAEGETFERRPAAPVAVPQGGAGLRGARGLGGRDRRSDVRSTTCPPRRSSTSSGSRSSVGVPRGRGLGRTGP